MIPLKSETLDPYNTKTCFQFKLNLKPRRWLKHSRWNGIENVITVFERMGGSHGFGKQCLGCFPLRIIFVFV